ncbi:hypothetical protein HNR02_004820 [Amycolatopsis endophytica]|uniref:Uncharacterized protein n=1 Tax=Amycolatopsis endophytica TaxID=860233 RepID=A0A853B9U5_9PSEU|nr:hypothetical protein [Amycolatopsis endophytica]
MPVDVQAVFDQPDALPPGEGGRALTGRFDVAVDEVQGRAQRADAVEFDGRCGAGSHHGDLDPPAAAGPREGLAEVARAGARHGPRTGSGERARDEFGSMGLEAADRVRRFELDAHRAAQAWLQRFAPVERTVREHRIDHPRETAARKRDEPGRSHQGPAGLAMQRIRPGRTGRVP